MNGHGRCHCCGEEAAGSGERGAAWGLYLRIDRQRLQCLNERREGSGALVFRAWEERGDRAKVGLHRGRRAAGREGAVLGPVLAPAYLGGPGLTRSSLPAVRGERR